MTTDKAETSPAPPGGLDRLLEQLAVLFLAGAPLVPDPETPGRILTLFDTLDDFTLTAGEVLDSGRLLFLKEKAAPFLRPGDRLRKEGRRLHLAPDKPRRFTPGPRGLALWITGPLTLAFLRPGEDAALPAEVSTRLDTAFQALPAPPPGAGEAGLLAAAVLPQRKKILGVETPLRVELLGFPFSLRFLIARFTEGKVRLFAAGPVVKEIPLGGG